MKESHNLLSQFNSKSSLLTIYNNRIFSWQGKLKRMQQDYVINVEQQQKHQQLVLSSFGFCDISLAFND